MQHERLAMNLQTDPLDAIDHKRIRGLGVSQPTETMYRKTGDETIGRLLLEVAADGEVVIVPGPHIHAKSLTHQIDRFGAGAEAVFFFHFCGVYRGHLLFLGSRDRGRGAGCKSIRGEEIFVDAGGATVLSMKCTHRLDIAWRLMVGRVVTKHADLWWQILVDFFDDVFDINDHVW